MIDFYCGFENCNTKASPIYGTCPPCVKHYCAGHINNIYNLCPDLSTEDWRANAEGHENQAVHKAARLQEKLYDIDFYKLGEEARPGFKVMKVVKDVNIIPHGQYNWYVTIDFDDDKTFYLPFRGMHYFVPPAEVSQYTIDSKIATMEALRERGLPVPQVIRCARDDTVLIERIPGKALETFDASRGDPTVISRTITQLADIYIQLSNFTFEGIGGLYQDKTTGNVFVGPLTHHQLAKSSSPHFPGPFKTNRDRFLSQIDEVLECYFEGNRLSRVPARDGIVLLWMRDLVKNYEPFNKEEPTYIKHADDHGSHILLDESGNITGLIDWDWAYTCPAAEAFSTPSALLRGNLLRQSSNDLHPQERELMEAFEKAGRLDLAQYIRQGKVHQRLDWIIGRDVELANLLGLEEAMTGEKGNETSLLQFQNRMKLKYGILDMEEKDAMAVIRQLMT